jgi:hypothetical protein
MIQVSGLYCDWIKLSKTDKTRASRIDQIVQLSLKEKLKGANSN